MRRYGGPARNKDDGPLMLTKTFGIVLSFPTLFIGSERYNEKVNHRQNVNRITKRFGRDRPRNHRMSDWEAQHCGPSCRGTQVGVEANLYVETVRRLQSKATIGMAAYQFSELAAKVCFNLLGVESTYSPNRKAVVQS